MKKLILLTIILLTPLFAQASTCEDDERLQDKRSLVKAVRSGEGISPKITILLKPSLTYIQKCVALLAVVKVIQIST